MRHDGVVVVVVADAAATIADDDVGYKDTGDGYNSQEVPSCCSTSTATKATSRGILNMVLVVVAR
jgi:hypothetical protein